MTALILTREALLAASDEDIAAAQRDAEDLASCLLGAAERDRCGDAHDYFPTAAAGAWVRLCASIATLSAHTPADKLQVALTEIEKGLTP